MIFARKTLGKLFAFINGGRKIAKSVYARIPEPAATALRNKLADQLPSAKKTAEILRTVVSGKGITLHHLRLLDELVMTLDGERTLVIHLLRRKSA